MWSEPIEQRVQRRARHGVDLLGRALAVREEALPAVEVVDHPAAHRDHELANVSVDAGAAQRVDPARREREVDRAAAALASRERRAALDDRRLEAAPREQDREQAAGGAAADDRDPSARGLAHASSSRLSARTAACTSRKRL